MKFDIKVYQERSLFMEVYVAMEVLKFLVCGSMAIAILVKLALR
jgi:hypothetical protein